MKESLSITNELSEKNDVFNESRKNLNNLQADIPENRSNRLELEQMHWEKMKNVDKIYPNGRIPAKNKITAGGRTFLLDEGLTFVLVEKGDTKDKIIQEVANIKPNGRDFSYLKTGASKMHSINIPANKIPINTWIPLPLKSSERIISDKDFYGYANDAINEISSPENSRDSAYSKEVKALVKEIGKDDLITWVMSVAKQESGGAPLGQFVFHRWENHRKAFSHSIFHVMMEGPGSEARKKLGMTPGQMNHPKNSVKLFLAFLIEKKLEMSPNSSATNTAEFLGNKYKKLEEFASFYNGKNWKKTNPHYVKNLKKYIKELKNPKTEITIEDSNPEISSKKPESAKKIANKYRESIEKTIISELRWNTVTFGEKNIAISDVSEKEITRMTEQVIKYLKIISLDEKFNSKLHKINITSDENKFYIRIIRKKDESLIGKGSTTIKREVKK